MRIPAGAGGEDPARLAYLVSRFPLVTETFIVRELDAVSALHPSGIELLALFPSPDGPVHPAARPWLERVHRPRALSALTALAWWSSRAPLAVAAVLAVVARDHARRPDVLARALITVVFAAQHARTVDRLGITHVHAHFASFPALAAWVISRLTGASFSITAHAHDLFVHQLGLRRRLRAARFVVAISQYNRGFMAALGAPVTPLIHCGVDVRAIRPRAPERRAPGAPLHVLMVSSFRDYKGHRVLIEALAGADERLAGTTVTFVGDGPLRAGIERLARERGVGDRLTFLGSLPEPDVLEQIAGADVLVQPSVVTPYGLTEGVPTTLMEAMAAGVPVISTRVSGIPELVRDGETGLLADPGDPDGLREALAAITAGPDAAAARAAAGRRLVEREYDVAASARSLVGLFPTGAAWRP